MDDITYTQTKTSLVPLNVFHMAPVYDETFCNLSSLGR